jgi:hypothetical protein
MMKILTICLPPQVEALKKPNKIQVDHLSIVSSSVILNDMAEASTMYALHIEINYGKPCLEFSMIGFYLYFHPNLLKLNS